MGERIADSTLGGLLRGDTVALEPVANQGRVEAEVTTGAEAPVRDLAPAHQAADGVPSAVQVLTALGECPERLFAHPIDSARFSVSHGEAPALV